MFDDLFGPSRDRKRTLGVRDKQILHERAKEKCENCKKRISFAEMQVGHKTAHSRGGSTQLRNLVSLCYKCNKLQGTDTWATFQRKQGKASSATATTTRTVKKSAKRSTKTAKKGAKKATKKTAKKAKKRSRSDDPFGFFDW